MRDWWSLYDGQNQMLVNMNAVTFITAEGKGRCRLTFASNAFVVVDADLGDFRNLVQPAMPLAHHFSSRGD